MKLDRSAVVPALLLTWLASAGAVLAQSARPAVGGEGEFEGPAWVGDVTFLGVNALLGGMTAGVLQELRGGSFQDGFTRGASGGAVAYAGRRLSVEQFYGAGLLGREVSAIGASIVRNSSEGRPSLERLFLPVGPLHVYVDRSGKTSVRAKLNLHAFAWTAAAALTSELRFDLGKSVSAGAPVFDAPDRAIIGSGGDPVLGMMIGNTILLSGTQIGPPQAEGQTFAHERVHVLQSDFQFYTWGDPLEGWAVRRTQIGSLLYRYLDVGVTMPSGISLFYRILDVDRSDRLRELEADFLEER